MRCITTTKTLLFDIVLWGSRPSTCLWPGARFLIIQTCSRTFYLSNNACPDVCWYANLVEIHWNNKTWQHSTLHPPVSKQIIWKKRFTADCNASKPARKRRLIEKEWRPQRPPPLPGFWNSPLNAFLCSLLKGEQKALSKATKKRGNSCSICPGIKMNKTPAVEKKFFFHANALERHLCGARSKARGVNWGNVLQPRVWLSCSFRQL